MFILADHTAYLEEFQQFSNARFGKCYGLWDPMCWCTSSILEWDLVALKKTKVVASLNHLDSEVIPK
jgi:hypothetical protein